jgi:hypothetical protein
MYSILLCTEKRGQDPFSKHSSLGVFSMNKTGSQQKLSLTMINIPQVELAAVQHLFKPLLFSKYRS